MDSGDEELRRSVLAALLSGRRLFLSGGAGTGKTYFVKRLAQDLVNGRHVTTIAASTGLAATLLCDDIQGASAEYLRGPETLPSEATHQHPVLYLRGPGTLHAAALLPWSDQEDRPDLISKGRQRLAEAQVIIIDEISMLDRLTFERFMRRIKSTVGILVVGDFFQLPPVREDENGEPDFAFQSPEFKSFELIELTNNHRQDDPCFIAFLDDLRRGRLNREYMSDIPVTLELDHPILFGTKAEAHQHNERQIATIQSKSFYSNAKVLVGERVSAIRWFENHTRAMQRFHFKHGMRVMCIQNQSLGRRVIVANGDLGTIAAVGPLSDDGLPEFLSVTFDRLGTSLPIFRHEFKKTVFVRGQERTVFKVKQFPFAPAYALTVHKAQGLTLDIANIDGARITFAAGHGLLPGT